MAVEFLKPTQELITHVAENMRPADAAEVWASSRLTPLEALERSWRASDMSAVVSVNGEPCAMLGLVVSSILGDEGIPWLLSTEQALKHKREFLKLVPGVISEMLSSCSYLFNYVHCENTVSTKWLKRIGFTMCDPAPYGPDGELFLKFHIRRGNCV